MARNNVKIKLTPKAMPSPNNTEDEATPTKLKEPATPRRPSVNKRSPNATPIQKASATKAGTPKSAPQVRAKAGGKKPEATLLGDFLLGRPSPSRLRNQRRKSLELIKAEMKKGLVEQLRPPGAVKDRVKQWQKASAGAGAPKTPAYDEEEIVVEVEEESAYVENEADKQIRPGREKTKSAADAKARARSASAPRKRVVSDDHWVKKKEKTQKTKSNENTKVTAGKTLPRDFTQKNWANQPLGSKIEDWAKRTIDVPIPKKERERLPETRKKSRESTSDHDGIRVSPSRRNSIDDDGIRVRPSHDSLKENKGHGRSSRERSASKGKSRGSTPDDGIRVFPSRSNSIDDGIRIYPSKKSSVDDGIRITPSNASSPRYGNSSYGPSDDGIRVRPIREKSRRREDSDDRNEHHVPRRKSEKYLRPPLAETSSRKTSTSRLTEVDTEDTSSRASSSMRASKRSEKEKSLDDIPLGSSAFSVLDIPVGAEANNIKRPPVFVPKPKPQRTNSITVPKVLKKVFNEGMKIMQDTVDPPRNGANHPPSIESWLNNTTNLTDPFLDRPAVPESILQTTTSGSTITEEMTETTELTEEPKTGSRRKRRVRRSTSLEQDDDAHSKEVNTTLRATPSIESLNEYMEIVDKTPITSPVGLKRTPATRTASSPAKGRWTPLKDALESAFRGESTYKISAGDKDRGSAERQNLVSPTREPLSRASPQPLESPLSEKKIDNLETPFKSPTKRNAPTTGHHRLSTIASSEALRTVSGSSDTTYMLSETTITQTDGAKSNFSRHRSNKPKHGLKRRLTKHSDLISVLSLPDSAGPRGGSIVSARSVRTTRNRLDTATLDGLMQELAADEAKYMRELKTLVDGVIPVLLTCVLSKSKAAIAAGLFNPHASGKAEPAITKPIVDMGVALERLKTLHKRIPLRDPDLLVNWAYGAHRVYEDYLAAWRMGFQDVIVNLAPASRASSPKAESSIKDGLPLNADGDVINIDGERVDVAFLLKRPIVRIKYMAKIIQGINMHRTTTNVTDVSNRWTGLVELARRRAREELARLEDQAANNTDPTRARDLRTLVPLEDVKIDRSRQVKAKDFFTLDLPHSTGQRMECRVEVILRDKPRDPEDAGDVLFCEVDTTSRWLLFQPVEWTQISARLGDEKNNVVVMVRGTHALESWRQVFCLVAEDEETAQEWVEMLGSSPVPASLIPDDLYSTISYSDVSRVTRDSSPERERLRRSPSPVASEIPFGERITKAETPLSHARKQHERFNNGRTRPLSTIYSQSGTSRPLDLNEAMERAGNSKPPRPSRYHGRHKSESPVASRPSSRTGVYDPERTPTRGARPRSMDGKKDSAIFLPPSDEIPIQKKRVGTPPSPEARGKLDDASLLSESTTSLRDDGAPPPPQHRTPSPVQRNSVKLDPPSSRTKRRGSSPLKHEYQPSVASETSSDSELSESESDDSDFVSGSSEDELDDHDVHMPLPGEFIYKKCTPPESEISLPNMSLGPSNSASQAPYRTVPSQPAVASLKFIGTMFSWNPAGRWEKLYPSLCSIVVTPGLIEAYAMSATHTHGATGEPTPKLIGAERPLIAMELTPLVPLRQSNATDIDLRSPPIARSLFKTSQTIMFRSRTVQECYALYRAIHHSRLHNPTYMALEQARTVGAYGGSAYSAATNPNRRSWFGIGRKQSYRASTRAPSTNADSENSANTFASAFSALKRLSGAGGGFNIAKSTIDAQMSGGLGDPDSANTSLYTSSSGSGATPSADGSSGNVPLPSNLGTSNLKVRVYSHEFQGWNDLGSARVTITTPPTGGMRQASSLYDGPEKRIIVVSKHVAKKEAENLTKTAAAANEKEKSKDKFDSRPNSGGSGGISAGDEKDKQQAGVILDVEVGNACFSRQGAVGVMIVVWEDLVGDDGRVGVVPGIGGVSGREKRWVLQCASAMEARWIFGLLGGGGGVGGGGGGGLGRF